MKIWIDIVNSPHVLFFKPLIEELSERGHAISITARTYAETDRLLEAFELPFTLFGAHAGASIVKKVTDVVRRSSRLGAYAKGKKFDVALTCNSPSMVAAAKILRIPSVVFMDYEHQPLNHFTFRLADTVVTPAVFPDSALHKYRAFHKSIKYRGLKEQVYLSGFTPDPHFLSKLGIDDRSIIVLVRPPGTMALYHRFDNELFDKTLDYIMSHHSATVVVLPRSSDQRHKLYARNHPRLVVLDRAVDGRNLVYHSDLVISAGGTMNREAAVLGIPVYTIFKGKMAAVDRHLITIGRMVDLTHAQDFNGLRLEKKKPPAPLLNEGLRSELVDIILKNGQRVAR